MGDLADKTGSAVNDAWQPAAHIERALREGLASGDRALSGVAPVLSHLLASTGHSLVSDAIVARLRGMLADIARQLAEASLDVADPSYVNVMDRFADQLSQDTAVLSHCYALAMEGHLAERLEQHAQIDPVLTPLLQELIASDHPEVGDLAMSSMAAQSRFIQGQRRMQLPVEELPAELFHAILRRWKSHCDQCDLAMQETVSQTLKHRFDEGASRIGLFARLTATMRGGAQAALDLNHAGLALFVSGLSTLTRQPRELAVLACHERQAARLALTLRAAGLNEAQIEQQFVILEPDERYPAGLDELSPQRAQALLQRSDAGTQA